MLGRRNGNGTGRSSRSTAGGLVLAATVAAAAGGGYFIGEMNGRRHTEQEVIRSAFGIQSTYARALMAGSRNVQMATGVSGDLVMVCLGIGSNPDGVPLQECEVQFRPHGQRQAPDARARRGTEL